MAGRYAYDIPEVTLFFNNKLLRGCRASKLDASGFGAFESPNFKPLAEIGVNITGRYLHAVSIIIYLHFEALLHAA